MTDTLLLPKIEVGLLYTGESEFEEFVLLLLRLKDDVGLKQIGFLAEEEICSKWEDSKGKSIAEVREILSGHVQSLLDKLLMLCFLLIQYDVLVPLGSIVSNIYDIYQIGGRRELGYRDLEKDHLSSSVIWKEVMARVYALGAFAIFYERFEGVPILVTKPWPKESSVELHIARYWAKHAFIMLTREGRLPHPSLCLVAEEKAKQHEWFFRKFKKNLDLFRNFVCQFDFLQCIYAFCRSKKVEDSFPSFGIFPKRRTEPIVLDLISGGKSRGIIPKLTDPELASAIDSLDNFAKERFSSYDGWTLNDWTNEQTREFLKKNLS